MPSGEHILILEDDAEVDDLAVRGPEPEGYVSLDARDGKAGPAVGWLSPPEGRSGVYVAALQEKLGPTSSYIQKTHCAGCAYCSPDTMPPGP